MAIDRNKAWEFAKDWVDAWNRHDVDSIMEHYDNSIEFCSPVVKNVLEKADGVVRGKENLRDYFSKQLNKYSKRRAA